MDLAHYKLLNCADKTVVYMENFTCLQDRSMKKIIDLFKGKRCYIMKNGCMFLDHSAHWQQKWFHTDLELYLTKRITSLRISSNLN